MLHPMFTLHHSYVAMDILVVSYVLSFAVWLTCCTRLGAQTADANAARRRNGLAIPLKASAWGIISMAWGRRNSSFFWEPGNCADGHTACDYAKRYARSPPRPGRRPDAALPLRIPA